MDEQGQIAVVAATFAVITVLLLVLM